MKTAQEYFTDKYGSGHIAMVVAEQDNVSLFGLMQEYAQWAISQMQPEWVAVTERWPKERPFEAYKLLVYGDWNDEVIAVYQDKHFYDPNVMDDSGNPTDITNLVTHWNYLPQPPTK